MGPTARKRALGALVLLAALLVAAPAARAQKPAPRSTSSSAAANVKKTPLSPSPAVKGASTKAAATTVAEPAPIVPEAPWNPGFLRIKSYADPSARELKALQGARGSYTQAAASEKPLVSVPPSFLGLSVDLVDIEGVAHPDFIGFIKHLTEFDTGPMLIRVGAYSADRLVKPWPGSVYKALATLHKATRAQFIMGVNQNAEDAELTAGQVERSEDLMPPGSVVSYAVGNEPDMYSLKPKKNLPGSLNLKPDDWLNTKWVSVAQKLYKAAFDAAGKKALMAGPDWSDPNIKADKLQWWLNSVKPFLNMVTVHLYGGDVLNDKKIDTILVDKRMLAKLSNMRQLVKTAKANGNLPLRVTEAATISYGGVQGISDTAGAALWALDASMEVAFAGGAGIHFHQVLTRNSNANYNAIYYNAVTNRVRARQPLWGYVMLQQALAGGADITGRFISGECKVWLLRGRKDGSLRILVINKADGVECAANVALDAAQAAKYADKGMAHYLYASSGLSDRWRVYYSNTFFDEWGSDKQSVEIMVPVARYDRKDRGGKVTAAGFAVHLTNGTHAALITVPLASKATATLTTRTATTQTATTKGGATGTKVTAPVTKPAAGKTAPASKAPATKAPAVKPPPAAPKRTG
ncbi:MAG: hypothetical protein J3K34DRAFT_458144 [Monoraphidium minutum]|nr:MAG: hypothetical protein J3K34DRAFT_458144 [Monoraphidium minutum]